MDQLFRLEFLNCKMEVTVPISQVVMKNKWDTLKRMNSTVPAKSFLTVGKNMQYSP